MFAAGGLRVALEASVVLDVVDAKPIQPIPAASPRIRGMVDVGGRLVPVLARRESSREPSHLLLIAIEGGLAALCVDDAPQRVTLPPHYLEEADVDDGMARLPDGLLLIRDVPRFLGAAEVRQASEIVEAINALRGGRP